MPRMRGISMQSYARGSFGSRGGRGCAGWNRDLKSRLAIMNFMNSELPSVRRKAAHDRSSAADMDTPSPSAAASLLGSCSVIGAPPPPPLPPQRWTRTAGGAG